jgi:hypothetical protein
MSKVRERFVVLLYCPASEEDTYPSNGWPEPEPTSPDSIREPPHPNSTSHTRRNLIPSIPTSNMSSTSSFSSSTITHSHPALNLSTAIRFADPSTPSNRRCHSRCARCSRTPSRCPRPCLDRRSVHAAGRRLRRARRGRPQGHRIGRQACSDLRGGSRGTNQYHSSEYGSHANVFTIKRVEHWNEEKVESLPRGTGIGRSSGPPSSSRSPVMSWRRGCPRR